MLCLNSGSTSFGSRIWRPIAPHCRMKAVPNSKAPPNAAFFSLSLEDAQLLSFVASHTPDFLRARKKEERKRENGNIAWCRSSLSIGLGARNHDIRVKHLVTQPGNAPKVWPSHLTMVNKDSPSKAAKGPLKDADPELRHSKWLNLPLLEGKKKKGTACKYDAMQLTGNWACTVIVWQCQAVNTQQACELKDPECDLTHFKH